MEDAYRTSPFRDNRVASRKAEETALRRFQAAGWIEGMVGSVGLSSQPSEMEFVSCLRNGFVLCNLLNKIQPGAVPKVIDNQSSRLNFDHQPPPAYQYFENIRNFVVAAEELRVPAFEASDIERDSLDSGSTAKIVDCILALKSFHEWKMYSGGNGLCKFVKSPALPHSSRFYSHVTSTTSEPCRRLMPINCNNQETPNQVPKSEDLLVKVLSEQIIGSKENIDHNQASVLNGVPDPIKIFTEIISSNLTPQCCGYCPKKVSCNRRQILEVHEKELGELKDMLSGTKREIFSLQHQLQSDLTLLGNQIQDLSVAALGYSQAMKENRNLYNLLQDLKGNIRVYCRIRPTFNSEAKSSISFIGDDGSLILVKEKNDSHKIFQFNKVFCATATQEEVYKDTQALVRSVMDGYNVCIFAYGQTGSGKTHTMFGPSNGSSKHLGINHLALCDLFEISCRRNEFMKYEVHVQMVEIYNDQVRDLLAEDMTSTKLEIRSCSGNGALNLPDAIIHQVRSPEDVRELMRLGECNRILCSTALNQRSSRSHSVLTVHVRGKEISGDTLYSRLHLVDLAGSERVDKSEVTGDRLKEAQYINKSLSCLADVITALGQKSSHIPYRNCKLTQLLQDSLGGQAKTLMFAHVSPEAEFYDETLSTLRFAQRVSKVDLGAAQINKESHEVRHLKEQVENLKKALGRRQVERSEYRDKVKGQNHEPQDELTTASCVDRSILENDGSVANERDNNKNARVSPAALSKSCTDGKNRQLLLTKSSDVHPSTAQLASEGNAVILNGDGRDAASPTMGSGNLHLAGDKNLNKAEPQRSPPPIRSSHQSRIPRVDNKCCRIMPLQQPKTPESFKVLEDEATSPGAATGGLSCKTGFRRSINTAGKGSQIRKSLRTIGKLINSSDRRNHQAPQEKKSSPVRGGGNDGSGGNNSTTLSASARATRRQSLTGLPASGLRPSRRSSLGGNSADSCSYEAQVVAKTPPSVQTTAKVTKRWL